MEFGILHYAISALWALATIFNLIFAARICYAIEARSGRPMLKGGLPGYANIIPVAFNYRVADDDQTQAMRWDMNKRLLTILGGFVIYAIFLRVTGVW